MNSKWINFFIYGILLFSLHCAAFPDPITSKYRNLKLTNEKKFKILFTGFYRYEQEKDIILENIKKQGIVEDPSSPLVLEIILQKKDPKYQFPLLHKIQFLLTFFTGGIFPSHIRSEQSLTFRYSKSDSILFENEYSVGMDQWRGIPVILLMITHWPNRIYKEQLVETTKLEFVE
ncbi:hypothetical protein [Leptospira bouyouniensis]|uniref:Lipoprotein n=1 Tax=Leptospira bouyouniensis TaxID=2484911 RepID=A0ABY2KZU8_9LEPT|nr:hypothetical protein [Leptospira bouyouniensis]TGK46557.1 hypothetical protein EHQ10_14370 [Leptospira bouyouniensis]TGM79657.1 hypothetical protein EHQ99_07905 [Leptospira bouyouniensis]